MTTKFRVVLAVAALALLFLGWNLWRHRHIELYGGVKPFMEKMRKTHESTASQLRLEVLPEDFSDMERLAQTAQDIFAVFKDDPRATDDRFGVLARELMRWANKFEQAWDQGDLENAKRAFVKLTNTCNACHKNMAIPHPPELSNLPNDTPPE